MMFGFVSFLDILSIIGTAVVMLWGAFLLLKRCLKREELLKIRFFKIISLFIFSNFLTMVLQIKNNFIINFAYWFYMILVFVLYYAMSSYTEFERIKEELIIIFKSIILINTVLVFLSLLTLFIPFSLGQPLGYEFGIYRNDRLTGVYNNPNLLGFCATISIIMNFAFFNKKKDNYKSKNIFPRWFSVSSIAINLIGLFLCDSNASFLFLIIYMVAFIFCRFCRNLFKFNLRSILSGFLVLLMLCVALLIGYFFARKTCQTVMNNTVNKVYEISDIDNQFSNDSLVDGKEKVSIGRRFGLNNYNDVSNGRIELLKQGIILFFKHPVMGIGRGNLEYYGKQYFENGLRFSDLHNGFLTILVSSGIVGFSLFLVWGICVAYKLFSCMFENSYKRIDPIFYHLVAILCGYCVYSLFESAILNTITFMTLFFWLILGYAKSYSLNIRKG